MTQKAEELPLQVAPESLIAPFPPFAPDAHAVVEKQASPSAKVPAV